MLEQKKKLFSENSKMEQCLGRLRSYLTTEQSARFLLLMEKVTSPSWPLKYKTKPELNVFKLWNIKRLDKHKDKQKIQMLNQGNKDSEEEEGLPDSDEDERRIQKGLAQMSGGGNGLIQKKTDMLLSWEFHQLDP